MHRFFLENQLLQPDRPVDLSPLAHQLRSVLRLSPGAMIQLLDGKGQAFVTEIMVLDRHQMTGRIHEQATAAGEPRCHLTLYQCSLKRDKFEWILQKGTELGVSRFVPVISQRSIVRPKEALTKKYDRWQVIIREAAEQSGRGLLPLLDPPLNWQEALDQAQGLRLLPWEGTLGMCQVGRLGSVAQQVAMGVQEGVQEGVQSPQIGLMIGPEGGLTEDEAMKAEASGWQLVSLGRRILRAETAALAGAAIIMSHLEM